MKVLALGAHPDDIEIFMLGLLLSFKSRGDEIYMAIATDGAAGNILGYSDLARIRKEETKKALNFLGDPYFFNFPDGELSSIQDVKNKIKEHILSLSPDLIITHAPEDYHPDHRTLSNLVKDAAGFTSPIIYADTLMGVNFIPDYFVDITCFIKKKTEAILKHKSQDPKKFVEATKLLNRFRSAQCNAPRGNYAEAYRQEKAFPFSDIRDLLPPSPCINQFYKPLSKSMI